MVEPLRNPIRPYTWGSRSVLAQLQGRAWPAPGPEAELWIGGHSTAPSTLSRGSARRSLGEIVAEDPAGELGRDALRRFGPRLPFLAKLLAVERPLSIQVHPDERQAYGGYTAERARRDTGAEGSHTPPTYTDPFGKPELLVSRTPFELLSGVRPFAEAAEALSRLHIAELDALASTLTDQASLREAFARLLGHDDPKGLIGRVAAACHARAVSAAPSCHGAHDRLLPSLARLYPSDPGVLVTLLLNYHKLPPDVAIFTPPGVPHAYLSGAGFEVMASSDNVLRGGLTAKKIDVAELLRLVSVVPAPIEPLEPTQLAVGLRQWQVPVAEFSLFGVDVDVYPPSPCTTLPELPAGWAQRRSPAHRPVRPPLTGPRLVMCDAGVVACTDTRGSVMVRQGEAAYCAASAGPMELTGAGSAFVVGVGG